MTDPNSRRRRSSLADQPHAIVERDGVRYTLLGTAHVSKASVDAVRAAIASGAYDEIAVELDPQRLAALTDPDALAQARPGQGAARRQDGVVRRQPRPGRATSAGSPNSSASNPAPNSRPPRSSAQARDLPLHLIDRDVGLTFKRASQRLGWWGRAKIGGGLVAALFGDEEVGEDEIEKLKQGDMLESSFGEFAAQTARRCTTPSSPNAIATWPRACANPRPRERRAQRARGRRRGPPAGPGAAPARRHRDPVATARANSNRVQEKSSLPVVHRASSRSSCSAASRGASGAAASKSART